MPSTVPYSLAFVGIILTASLAVLGQGSVVDDPCFTKITCQECVITKTNITVGPEGGNNGTCIFELTTSGNKCVDKFVPSEEVTSTVWKLEGCAAVPTPAPSNATTTPAPSTTTPPTPPTPSTKPTTPVPTPSTNGTSTTTVAPTTVAPNTTTTTVPPTTTPHSNATTTAVPSNSTTVAPTPTPTPTPRKGGFAWGEFIGGIVFAVALSSLAYLIWRFYKARLDRNYHTFSNPTF